MSTIRLRNALRPDLQRCYEIERLSYSKEEAASKSNMQKRLIQFPQGFLLLENDKEIIGFINSGACHEVQLSDENFKEMLGHDNKGKYIVVMSVVVHPHYQKQGFVSLLMKKFIEDMQNLKKEEIFFICKKELIPMYEKYGFKDLGESSSTHGGVAWNEMSLSLI